MASVDSRLEYGEKFRRLDKDFKGCLNEIVLCPWCGGFGFNFAEDFECQVCDALGLLWEHDGNILHRTLMHKRLNYEDPGWPKNAKLPKPQPWIGSVRLVGRAQQIVANFEVAIGKHVNRERAVPTEQRRVLTGVVAIPWNREYLNIGRWRSFFSNDGEFSWPNARSFVRQFKKDALVQTEDEEEPLPRCQGRGRGFLVNHPVLLQRENDRLWSELQKMEKKLVKMTAESDHQRLETSTQQLATEAVQREIEFLSKEKREMKTRMDNALLQCSIFERKLAIGEDLNATLSEELKVSQSEVDELLTELLAVRKLLLEVTESKPAIDSREQSCHLQLKEFEIVETTDSQVEVGNLIDFED